jgi:phosphoglycerate kinase
MSNALDVKPINKLTVDKLPVHGKRVLVRVDYNVPMEDGKITDTRRIDSTIDTINSIISRGGKAILTSHLGRPDGKVNKELSLEPIAAYLRDRLHRPVKFITDCVGDTVTQEVMKMKNGEIILLENVRFHPEEELLDEYDSLDAATGARVTDFTKQLASLGEVYVNDAFGTAHRNHASTAGVTKHIKECAAGFLMQKELENLSRIMLNPPKPFCLILGGSKVSDKIKVIDKLLPQVTDILIGGAMAYTFLEAQGVSVGKSKVERLDPNKKGSVDGIKVALEVLEKAKRLGVRIHLPVDHVTASNIDAKEKSGVSENIPENLIGIDIGPKTIENFSRVIQSANSVLWNGPMGKFETEAFEAGSKAIARAMVNSRPTISVVGGGDTAKAVEQFGLASKMTHVSTGGGASLEFLEGVELPGVAGLTNS